MRKNRDCAKSSSHPSLFGPFIVGVNFENHPWEVESAILPFVVCWQIFGTESFKWELIIQMHIWRALLRTVLFLKKSYRHGVDVTSQWMRSSCRFCWQYEALHELWFTEEQKILDLAFFRGDRVTSGSTTYASYDKLFPTCLPVWSYYWIIARLQRLFHRTDCTSWYIIVACFSTGLTWGIRTFS